MVVVVGGQTPVPETQKSVGQWDRVRHSGYRSPVPLKGINVHFFTSELWRHGLTVRCARVATALGLSGAALLAGCSPNLAEKWLVSKAFREPAGRPRALSETRSCDFSPGHEVMSAAVAVSWPLGQRVRLAGYGVFPFWTLAPWVSKDAAPELGASNLTGQLLVVRGRDRLQPARGVWWVLVSLDTIGVPTPLADRMRSVVTEVLNGESGSNGVLPCVVTTVVASHSHSGPDLTGLWGSAATAWEQARNEQNWAEGAEAAITGALARDVARGAAKLAPSYLSLSHAHVPTSAAARLRGSGHPNLSLVRFARRSDLDPERGSGSSSAATARQGDPALLIWNGHATTDAPDRRAPSGDYPATLARTLAPELELAFVPGAVAGQYPVVRDGWLGDLSALLQRFAQGLASPFGMRVAELDYCVAFEARHAPLFEAWSARWGVPLSLPCELQAEEDTQDAGAAPGKQIGFRVTVQRVTFLLQESLGTTPTPSATSFSLYFLPFEVFQEAEDLLRAGQAPSVGQDAGVLNARAVSLANGFSGHALSRASWQALTSLRPAAETLAKPYHAWMSVVGAIDPLILDAVLKLQDGP